MHVFTLPVGTVVELLEEDYDRVVAVIARLSTSGPRIRTFALEDYWRHRFHKSALLITQRDTRPIALLLEQKVRKFDSMCYAAFGPWTLNTVNRIISPNPLRFPLAPTFETQDGTRSLGKADGSRC